MNRPRQVSDAQICEKAREVFVEQGPQAPVSAVAERLGVSSAALFKRFGSKEELMLTALSPPDLSTLEWFSRLHSGPTDEATAKEQLQEHALSIGRFLEDHVPQITCLVTSGIPPHRAATRHNAIPAPFLVQVGLAGFIARLQAANQVQSGNSMHMATSLLGALHMRAFTLQFSESQKAPQPLENFVEELLTALWAGLSPTPRCPSSPQCDRQNPPTGVAK